MEKQFLKSQLYENNKLNNYNSIDNYEISSPINKTYLNKSTTTNIKEFEMKLTPFQKNKKEKLNRIKYQFEKPYFCIYNNYHNKYLKKTKNYFSLDMNKNNSLIKDFTKSYSGNFQDKIKPKLNFHSPKIKKTINLKKFIYNNNFGIKNLLITNINLRNIINNQS